MEYYIEYILNGAGKLSEIDRFFTGRRCLANVFDTDYFVCQAFIDRAAGYNIKVLKGGNKAPKLRLVCWNYAKRSYPNSSSVPHIYIDPLNRALAFKMVDGQD